MSLISDLPPTVGDCLSLIKYYFRNSGLKRLGNPIHFLCGITGLSACEVVAYPGIVLDKEQLLLLKKAIIRYLKHESMHRIIGWRSFYNLRLSLSVDTFEPRPETELLVDVVLSHFFSQLENKSIVKVLDLGTGTGAICLSLLKECSNFKGYGVDISSEALKIASNNAIINGVSDRFSAIQSDWFSSVNGVFDIIVSNPPYISSDVIDTLGSEVKYFDPHIALDGGTDGLFHYRVIADGISKKLTKGGFCCLEIGYNQKLDVVRIFEDRQLFLLNSFKDYGGNDRALLFYH
ncbi:rRNA or tRNA methylase [Candidatus Liberibacter americanus str. Sao Paulo]|uniref:peptide chain release factor N(5)-glutamine methyltransferase n=1 Tax=Candidatus Liberibacter americanus str. Sao Paulo TaxID=1261131 RepID=U6B872_9HYPH|nr:rRNA or tRNA methylase [Candidatus Liberibacter americanus str. Sao Paulo]